MVNNYEQVILDKLPVSTLKETPSEKSTKHGIYSNYVD